MLRIPRIEDPRCVQKPEYMNCYGEIDTTPLNKALNVFSKEDWIKENARKPNQPIYNSGRFDNGDGIQHIVFMWPQNFNDVKSAKVYSAWDRVYEIIQDEMKKICSGIFGIQNVGFSKVVFALLEPKSQIEVHTDEAKANYFSHKIHIPLQTNPLVNFNIFGSDHGGENMAFFLEKDKLYEPNNLIPHGVINDSEEQRIHFIMECFDKDLF